MGGGQSRSLEHSGEGDTRVQPRCMGCGARHIVFKYRADVKCSVCGRCGSRSPMEKYSTVLDSF